MRTAWIAALAVMSTGPAWASGDSSQTLRVPVVDATGKLTSQKRVFTYPHYYAGTVTAASMILAAPCSKTKPTADDSQYADLGTAPYDPRCNRINPLGAAAITLSFGIPGADEPPTHTACTLTVDLSRLVTVHPLLAKAGLGSRKAIVGLAIRTLEDNSSGNLFDCAIAYTGATATGDLPSIFRPVATCGKSIARPWWRVIPAEQKARDVLGDCTKVDRVIDLAATMAGSRFEETLALLERARKLSELRTFERFATDPAFDALRNHRRGSDFFTAVRVTDSPARCTHRDLPTAKIKSVKLQGTACIITLDTPIATLGPNQRWSTFGAPLIDEKRPNVVRRLRFRDASTIVASTDRVSVTEICKPAMFDAVSIGAETDELDNCTIRPVAR